MVYRDSSNNQKSLNPNLLYNMLFLCFFYDVCNTCFDLINYTNLVGMSLEVYAILFCAQSSNKIVCNFDFFCFIGGNLLFQWARSSRLGFNSPRRF
jgi:hypothetical protein